MAAVGQRGIHIGIAHDRPGDQLREKRQIGAEKKRIAGGFGFAVFNIAKIGNGLKSIKGNSQREGRRAESGFQSGQKCVCVFEIKKNQKVERKSGEKKPESRSFPATGHQPRKQEVKENDKEHQKDPTGFSPAVKNKADKKQNEIPKI